jgi:hypothetical protein
MMMMGENLKKSFILLHRCFEMHAGTLRQAKKLVLGKQASRIIVHMMMVCEFLSVFCHFNILKNYFHFCGSFFTTKVDKTLSEAN